MENEPSSFLQFLSLLLLFISSSLFAGSSANEAYLDLQVDVVIDFAEEEVKERLLQLDQSLLEHRLDESVRRLIKYHLRHPKQTALNVGRAVAFFPIFEEELAAAGLPESLKYLPVIESALRPWVSSRVGAVGLWQFMPETAPEYGLLIDEYVDERMDARKSTQAAIRYLMSAYEYLDDWSLAIAAYNAGKGRVNRAKRRSGGKNFWSVRRHLPRETRNYVPAFIAAIYLTEFYAAHDLELQMPSLDEQLLASVKIYSPLSFYQLAQITGLSIDVIQRLNPSYIKGFLPAYPDGHELLIPKRVAPALREYLNNWASKEREPFLPWRSALQLPEYVADDSYYQTYIWPVSGIDSLESIAQYTGFSASQLAIWNRLTPLDSLEINQEIKYYRPLVYQHLPKRDYSIIDYLPSKTFLPFTENKQIRPLPSSSSDFYYITLKKRERPSIILQQFPNISIETLMGMNALSNDKFLAAGSILKISRSL